MTTNRNLAVLYGALLISLSLSLIIADKYVEARGWRFIWFLLAGLGDGVAAFFGLLTLLRIKARLGTAADTVAFLLFQVMALGAILLDDAASLLANAFWPPQCSHYTLAHGLLFWNGRFAKTFGVLLMVLYQMNLIDGHRDSRRGI